MNRGVVLSVEQPENKGGGTLTGEITTVPSGKCIPLLVQSVEERRKFRLNQVVTVRFTAEIVLAQIIHGTNLRKLQYYIKLQAVNCNGW
jgi:hypothetical protein